MDLRTLIEYFLVTFTVVGHVCTVQTLAREEGWEYFIFVLTEFYIFTVSGFELTSFRFGIKKEK